MPKFSFDYYWTMNGALQSLGMPTAFSDFADFTGLNEIAEAQTHIDKVIHKTHITVNENRAVLTCTTTLDAKVYGFSSSWDLHTNAYYEKIDGDWIYCDQWEESK
jgi:serpin B